jgi:hypothetical protein
MFVPDVLKGFEIEPFLFCFESKQMISIKMRSSAYTAGVSPCPILSK